MRIVGRGVVNSGEAGGPRAVATFPSITRLSDSDLLAAYRVGSTKDSDDETIEIRRSSDEGRSWSDAVQPFSSILNGRCGSLKVAYVTQLEGTHLVAAALWVDREAGHGQGKPLNLLLRDAVDQRIFVMWQLGMLTP